MSVRALSLRMRRWSTPVPSSGPSRPAGSQVGVEAGEGVVSGGGQVACALVSLSGMAWVKASKAVRASVVVGSWLLVDAVAEYLA